jgi:hypothetical protein
MPSGLESMMLNRLSFCVSRHVGLRRAFLSAAFYAVATACIALSSHASAQTAHLSSGTQNLGSVNVGTASSPATLTFTFDTAGTLGSTSVVTQGATGLDFTDAGTGTCAAAHSYAAASTCTVKATFTPKFSGVRYGAAVLYNNSGTPIATGYLQGTGTGPQVNFSPGTETTIVGDLNYPDAIAVDESGNLYLVVEDYENGRILKETQASGGYSESTLFSGFDAGGIAVDGSGNLYISSSSGGEAFKETLSNGSYIQSTITADLNEPYGIAVDGSGNVYIADSNNGRVLLETLLPAGGYAESVIVTCGAADVFSFPAAVAVDGSGNIYVTNLTDAQAVKLTPSAGCYTPSTFGTGLSLPDAMVIDGNGNLFIADAGNYLVIKETPSHGSYVQTTLPTGSSLYQPYGVAVDGSGNVFISDSALGLTLKEDLWDAPTLAFADTPVGTTSSDSPRTVTLENNGNATLSFPVPGAGGNPGISANFTLNSTGASACPLVAAGASAAGTLAAGATCQLPISYAPTAATPLSGALVLTDNSLNAASPSWATQTISLSAGEVSGKDASQTTINASAKNLSQNQSITLTVTVAGVSGAVAPSGTVTIRAALSSAFGDAAFALQTLTLNSAGTATWTSSTLGAGLYDLSASYSGDGTYAASTAASTVQFRVIGPPAYMAFATDTNDASVYGYSGPPLYVFVWDSGGNGLQGVTVTMGGAGLIYPIPTAITDSEGIATAMPTATQAGILAPTATVSGITTPATFAIRIYPAPLTVTVLSSPGSQTYGTATLPTFTNTVSGLVNGDTLGGTVIVTDNTSVTASSPVGSYSVAPVLSGSSATNYGVTAIDANLQIIHAPLTVIAKNVGIRYGQSPPPLTGYFFNGFVNGDNASVVSGAPVLTTSVTSTTPRGNYPIGVAVGTLSAANYKISTIGPQGGTGSVNVTKAPLTVTANTVTMTEGGTVPPLTYTITGFVNGEDASVVSGSALLSTTVTSSTHVGEYFINVNVGPLSAENYYFVPAVHGGVVKVSK